MKKNALDKAIEALESKKAVLQLAIDELKEQQAKKVPRTRKAKAGLADTRTESFGVRS